jgi:hypothetical protein
VKIRWPESVLGHDPARRKNYKVGHSCARLEEKKREGIGTHKKGIRRGTIGEQKEETVIKTSKQAIQ